MKKIVSATFILVLMTASFTAFGQTSDEKEREQKERESAFFEKQEEASERARARESERSSSRARASTGDKSGISYFAKPDYPDAPTMTYSTGDGVYVMSNSGSSSSSQLSLSKKFDGQSSENDGTFDVDESVRHISLQLSGSVKQGSIEITITLPDGEELKDLSIDTSADIQFNQSIKIAADEDRYYGQWEYSVESDEAVGYYRLSIQTR